MDTFSIGNINIERYAALAPMASVADRSYRLLCRDYGAVYTVSEMISSKGLCYGDNGTAELCSTDGESPYALQLFGEEASYMGAAARILCEKYHPQITDINMGCPVRKIVSSGSGSKLMTTPKLASDIVKAVVSHSDCPVTVKIRKGWDDSTVNAVEFACLMEESGASAITVHGRTSRQMYHGYSDMDIIRQVKQAVKIPVIGNGDVATAEDCARMYEYTGCDLVMIGRGSYGRPWIFKQVRDYLDGRAVVEPDDDERLDILRRHVMMIVHEQGESVGIRQSRKFAAWYLKGMKSAARLRNMCSTLETVDDLDALIREAK